MVFNEYLHLTRDPRIVQSFKSKCKIAYFKITVLPVRMARGYFE